MAKGEERESRKEKSKRRNERKMIYVNIGI